MLNVGDSPAQLRAAVLAMKRADKSIKKDVGQRLKTTMSPVWKQELTSKAGGGITEKMLTANARIANSNPAQLITANSTRGLGKGKRLVPVHYWAGYEYGANRNAVSIVTSKKGKTFKRHTKRHLPERNDGRVIQPTVTKLLPRVAAFWTQSIVRAFMDAAEGK